MPLVKPTLQKELNDAFAEAMNKFIEVVKQGGTDDVSSNAIKQAALTFANKASSAIDKYIKSATIIVPPGQTIAGTGGGPAPVVGATSAPSAPATIS